MRQTREYTCTILTLVKGGVLNAEGVLLALLNYMSEDEVREFWEAKYASDFEEEEDGDDSEEEEEEEEEEDYGDDEDDGWAEESANMAAMAGGVHAYNEAMGFGEGEPNEGW